jgi:uncharacterized membrane protein YbhN (UPF0104 family)
MRDAMDEDVKNKPLYRPLISLAILATLLFVAAFYLRENRGMVLSLLDVSPIWMLSLIILRVAFLTTNGLFLREFAAKFGVRLDMKEWFGLAIVTAMGNYLSPFSGGVFARAAYLKQRHGFPYTQFVMLLSANYLVAFWVVGVLGLFVSVGYIREIDSGWIVLLFFLTVTLLVPLLSVFPWSRVMGVNRVSHTLNHALDGWLAIRRDKRFLSQLLFYTFLNVAFNAFSFWAAYKALNQEVPIVAALLVSLMAVFSLLINITPAGLGIQEATIALSSSLVGIGPQEGFLVALLIRGATLVPVFGLGPVFAYILTQNLLVQRPE